MRFLILIPILIAFGLLEVFIGGARLLYAIPGITLVSIAAFFSTWPGLKTSRRADIPALVSVFAFSFYFLLRNRLSDIEYIARMQFTIMVGCLMIYLIFALVLTKPSDRRRLFVFLLFLALLQLWPALVQFSQCNDWMPLSLAQRRGVYTGIHNWRASGFFIYPNNFAGYMEVVSLIAMSFTIWGKFSGIVRILMGYTALAGMAGVLMSGSRGGYLSLTTGIIVVIFLSLKVWKKLPSRPVVVGAVVGTALLIILGSGLFVALHSNEVGTRIGQINDPGNMRPLLWRAALNQFQLSPIWGTGGFSYLHYGRLFRDPSVQNDPIHAHNDYLQLLADYGLVGISLFMIMLILHLRSGITSFRHLVARTSDWDSPLGDRLALNIGCQSALAAYMVHSLVDFNMQLPLNALMMASVFAVLVNPGTPREDDSSVRSGEWIRSLMRWSLPVIGIAFMLYELPMIRGELYAERSRLALRDGHADEALNLARVGITKTRDNPELFFDAGEAALRLSMDPDRKSSAQGLRIVAADAFAAGLKLFPQDSRLAIKLAQALAATGDYFSASDALARADQLDPNSSFVSAYRGVVEYSFGHFDEAELAFNRSMGLGGEATEIATTGLRLINQARQQSLDQPVPTAPTSSDQTSEKEEAHPSSTPSPLPDSSENTQDLLNSQIPGNLPRH